MSNRLDGPSRVRHPKWTLCEGYPKESHESEVSHPLFTLTGSQRGWHQRDPLLRLGIPNLAELRRFLPRQAYIAAQTRIENLPRLAMPSRTLPHSCPNIVPVVMNVVVVSLCRINLVVSTLKLRSSNCVKWRPPKKDGPSCNNRDHFPNLILCRRLSMLAWCAFPRPPIRWSSTSSNTQPTNSPGAIQPPSAAGSSRTANLLKRQGSNTFIS